MLELTGAASAGGNCSTLLFHDVAQDMVWEQGGAMKSLSLLPEASQASCRRPAASGRGEPVHCLHRDIDSMVQARGFAIRHRMTAGRVYALTLERVR